VLVDDRVEHLGVWQPQVAVEATVKGLGRGKLPLKGAAQVVARKLAVGGARLCRHARLRNLHDLAVHAVDHVTSRSQKAFAHLVPRQGHVLSVSSPHQVLCGNLV
jgi:hypothetical protein